MAKGQQRSNREVKKPKAVKKEAPAPVTLSRQPAPKGAPPKPSKS